MIALLLVLAQAATPISGTVSKPDGEGAYTVTLDIPEQPARVGARGEWERIYYIALQPGQVIRKVRSFIGVDRGDVWEGHLFVEGEDFPLHRRGPHKEGQGEYDAWAWEPVRYVVPAGGRIFVHLLCHPTGSAPVSVEFGVVLEIGR